MSLPGAVVSLSGLKGLLVSLSPLWGYDLEETSKTATAIAEEFHSVSALCLLE